MSTRPSTYLDRRLVVSHPVTVHALPEDWPRQTGQRLRVDPPVELVPGKRYRVALDLDAGTAQITEEDS